MSKENKIVFLVVITIATLSVLGIFISKKNTAYNDALEIADNVLKNEGYTLLYLGSSDCDGCHLEESQIKPLLETYDFGFFYINLNEGDISGYDELCWQGSDRYRWNHIVGR